MHVSIVIRTLNEEKYLDELFHSVAGQALTGLNTEVVLVDSGSTDRTLSIAEQHGARIVEINKSEFSFGRSLNLGCSAAHGEILVFLSGHCIAASDTWLHELIAPIRANTVDYSYGRQIGRDNTRFSESRVFDKYYPSNDMIPQNGFFCNNANAAIRSEVWAKYKFDEELTGLEDMFLAKQISQDGYKIGYVAKAPVYHIHNENWQKIKMRYEREAIALQQIMPEVHVSTLDLIKLIPGSIISDCLAAVKQGVFWQELAGIILFRTSQYWGGYKGNHIHRKLSREAKRKYFYPNEPAAHHRHD